VRHFQILIVILAPLLTGRPGFWALLIFLFLNVFFFVLYPPERQIAGKFIPPLVLFFLLGLISFFPAQLFFNPPWREALVMESGLPKLWTISVEPWISLDNLVILGCGLLWLVHGISRPIEFGERQRILRLFSSAAAALVLIALLLNFFAPREWLPSPHNLGFFKNRNQMSNFMVLAAVITLACLYEDHRFRERGPMLFRSGCLAIILFGLGVNASRSGPVLFLLGTVLWFAWVLTISRTAKKIALGASAFLLLGTVFLLFGGETLERIINRTSLTSLPSDLRILLHVDVARLVLQHPLTGTGLGTFDEIFAFYRNASQRNPEVSQSIALHPESDWLWMVTEMGMLSAIVAVWGIHQLARHILPIEREKGYALRMAAAVAVLLFIIHSTFDVSTHRMGTYWVAAWLAGIASPSEFRDRKSPGMKLTFRIAGGLLAIYLVMGAALQLSARSGPFQEHSALEKARELMDAREYAMAETVLTRTLTRSPFSWEFYFERALVRFQLGRMNEAQQDFRRARRLQPRLAEIRTIEGTLWAPTRPILALGIWKEALELDPPRANGRFQHMLAKASNSSLLYDELLELARDKPAWLLTALQLSPNEERYKKALSLILKDHPKLASFTPEQLRTFFSFWYHRDREELCAFLEANPEHNTVAWDLAVKGLAEKKDYKKAYHLIREFDAPRVIPAQITTKTLGELRTDFLLHPNDLTKGMLLYQEQMLEKKTEDAFQTIRQLTSLKDCPKYLHFHEAEHHSQRSNFQQAYQCWLNSR
jgi:tetratricopeptide (TPR) repeat protein